MTESVPKVSPQSNDRSKRKSIVLGGSVLAAALVAIVALIFFLRHDPGVKPDQLNSLLLDAEAINTVLGASDMQPGELQVEPARPRGTLSNPDCLSALAAAQSPTYASSGYTASRWGWMKDSEDGAIQHYVVQAVATFPDAAKASAFVQGVAEQWKACSGETVTVNADSVDTWLIEDVTGEPPSIALLESRTDVAGWVNQRALRAVSNVVIDVSAAGYHITDQGNAIANKIAGNVPV